MTARTPAENKAIVLEGFETLFNRKDLVAAERFWSSVYTQHSAHVPPGRDGLFELVATASPDMRYECQLAVAEGDFVMLHGRFSGLGQPTNWVVVDVLRLEDGVMVEHWDVIQDEVTRENSVGGHPMFGDQFPG
ncbi:ester cyclase [Pseudomonas batumici]|uniref:nuclear transport factor 2 family protein n=1 Tax=Pseudomonas batumici TaxID=226910 RepID=UPI0030CD8E32